MIFWQQIRRVLKFLRQENLLRVLFCILTFVIMGAIGLQVFEPDMTLVDAIWWSIVTLTTVGYGDITPVTIGGRITGIFLMLTGIGLLGLFTATIAGIFVETKLKRDRGMSSFKFENHIILCEWNLRAREILNELRSNRRTTDTPIVLIADIETKPVNDDQLFFIQGDITEKNLNRANLSKAANVIVLGDDRVEPTARDAKVVLSTLTIETLNPAVYSVVELVDDANVRHCERANADEIIVGSDFSSKLISRAAIDHGISKVISELLSSRFGSDLGKMPVPNKMAGRKFIEIFTEMKREHGSIVLAVQKGDDGEVISNPETDYVVEVDDRLIVISTKKQN